MLDWNHGRLSRTLGLGCAAALAATGLSLGTANAATQDQDSPTTEKVEKRVIIRNVGEGPMREPLSAEMREKIAKCEGQPIEANADLKGADGKQQRTRVVLCTKGDPKMVAERLEKSLGHIESDTDMSPEAKAKILAELRAKIAELRSR